MVQVRYRNSNIQYFIAEDLAPQQSWVITKKFRLNPLTNSDQPYDPNFYRRHSYGDGRTPGRFGEIEHKVRAIQTMLHQQTNYNRLVRVGFYCQPYEIVKDTLRTWYRDIARKFPAYREACEMEYARHLRRATKQPLDQ